MEEQFFFKYHLKCSRKEFRQYPIKEKRWMIKKFIEQKTKEQEAMDKAKKNKSGK